jgi:hypothetical protein
MAKVVVGMTLSLDVFVNDRQASRLEVRALNSARWRRERGAHFR